MSLPVSRRTFLGESGLAAAGLALPCTSSAIIRRGASRPAAVSSSNGLPAVNRAMELVLRGTDTLDAAIEGVKIQDLDPADNSVGYGGLPNEDGVVQLDASGPRLLTERRPSFNLPFYAVSKRGDFGSASLYPARYAAHDGKSGSLRDTAYLYERRA